MKHLNKAATAVFMRLIEGLQQPGDHRKFEQSSAFMPVSVEVVDRARLGPVVSVAHYYQQNGDLMADPEMTFLVASGVVHPMTFQQDSLGIYQQAVGFSDGGNLLVAARMQRDITAFASQWMVNIKQQQFTG